MPNLFKLDQKDKKILAALDLNARESNSVIAKQLQLSKNIINYRINQLEQQKIIKSYKTIIDFSKIPLTYVRVYLDLYEFHPEKEDELVQYLSKNKIILGYRTELDFSKLGYEYYKVDLELEDPKIIKDLLHHCKAHPNVIAITKAISDNIDFEFDIETKNFDTFLQFMNHLKTLFPRAIRDYKYLKYVEILKNN